MQQQQLPPSDETNSQLPLQCKPEIAVDDNDPIAKADDEQLPSQQTDEIDLSALSDEELPAGSVMPRHSQTSEDVIAELLVADKPVDAPQMRADSEQTDDNEDDEEEVDLTGDTGHAEIAPPMRIVGKRKVGDGTDAFEYSVLPKGQWLHQDAAELDQNARREWDHRQEQGNIQNMGAVPAISDEGNDKPAAKHHIVLGQDPPASLVNNKAAGIGLGLSVEALKKADVLRRKGVS